MNKTFFILILFLCSVSFVGVHAEPPPIPKSKKEAIGNYDERLKQYREEKEQLEKEHSDAKSDLSSTRQQLVDVADMIQDNESRIQSLNTQITELEVSRDGLNADLEEDRVAISHLILALNRIRRMPPEAMIARPDAPIETARSAMLLEDIIPALDAKAKDLRVKLDRLNMLESELQDKKDKALVASKKLKSQQKDLEGLVDKREALYSDLDKDIKEKQAKVKQISQQSQNLRELVEKLEDERTRNQKKATRVAHLSPSVASLPAVGKSQLPLSGIVRVHYDEKDTLGAASKGVSIEGYPGALIVAPMDGIVRFAGYFKNYGNMVILEHKNGYHSLIAGLEKIDTVVDQGLLAGEPIGTLYHSKNGKAPTLYFELRLNGKAINPARKFAGLG